MGRDFRAKIHQKFVTPVLAFLKQGMTPHKLALSLSLGVCLGLFPVIGVTTILCLAVAFIMRLNMAAIQLVNYVVYPIQILCIIPLMKLGSMITHINPVPYTIEELLEMMGTNFFDTLEIIWLATILGILAWAITIIPISVSLYFVLRSVFMKMSKA